MRLAFPAVICLLLLLLAAEWLLPGQGAELRQPPALPTATADAATDADVAQWANIILARPLLSESRRPAPPPGSAVSDALPRLSAIIVVGGSRRAIFAAAGEKPQMLAEGGKIGLYRIKTVAADTVELLGPNGKLTLRPQFIAATPASPPAAQ